MTQNKEKKILGDIKRLVRRSYEDDGNSYEIEFRNLLEYIWDELDKDIKKLQRNKG